MGDMSMYFRMIDSLVARSDDVPPGYATRKQVNHLSIHSFTCPFIVDLLIHLFIYSITCLFTCLFTCPFTHSLVHSLVHQLVHSPVHSLITCPFTDVFA